MGFAYIAFKCFLPLAFPLELVKALTFVGTKEGRNGLEACGNGPLHRDDGASPGAYTLSHRRPVFLLSFSLGCDLSVLLSACLTLKPFQVPPLVSSLLYEAFMCSSDPP